ncbi:MAG: acyl-CoA dehydrogenase family protein [Hyphomonadaceae bacterium]|nr:acyl-CoA dehydrogenase family protein [Hyphomonadaceae bacterium]
MDGSFAEDNSAPSARNVFDPGPTFRRDVETFLDRKLTPALRQAGRETTGLKSAPEAYEAWRAIVHEQGWLAPSWPARYGGTGWTLAQQLYFDNACAERDAPILASSGIRTIGPLIIAAGNAEQKAHYLPAILSGAHEWCQGFSEPQAGSDLTALSLRAEQEGDDFVLNGSKIWTSFAHHATHMFLLARVDPSSRRHDGLVFLLLKMDTPGVSVQPIPFIDGDCETNQVFFDNVRIPVSDRIGDIGDGWTTARKLMAIARSNNTTTGVLRRAYRMALRGAQQAQGLDDHFRTRFADLKMRIDTFEAVAARNISNPQSMAISAPSSVLKILATELHQEISALGLDVNAQSSLAQSKYFATRAASIYSGTNEIHRNILAKAIGCTSD